MTMTMIINQYRPKDGPAMDERDRQGKFEFTYVCDCPCDCVKKVSEQSVMCMDCKLGGHELKDVEEDGGWTN